MSQYGNAAVDDNQTSARYLRGLGGGFFLLFLFAGGDGQIAAQGSFLFLSAALLGASELMPGLLGRVRRRRQAAVRRAQPPGLINWPEKPSSRGSSRAGRLGEPRRNSPRFHPRTRPAAATSVSPNS